jgi:hypothetical protein
MKYLFTVLLIVFFSINSFALSCQDKKPDPVRAETGVKPEKKITKVAAGKKPALVAPAGNNEKRRKEPEESTGYYGPLSWNPGLIY